MTAQSHRLPRGGRIDRSRVITFTLNGEDLTGNPGDTVASALLANGRIRVADSAYRGRPRGIMTAGVEEPNALLRLGGACSEPMVVATTVPLVDGLAAQTLSGPGRLDPEPDEAIYDKTFAHTDVLVIGGGPAGLAAATAAAGSGARVILVDDQPELGGYLLSGRDEHVDGVPALDWVRSVAESFAAAAEVTVLTRTTAFASNDDNFVLALQHRTDHLGSAAPAGVSRQRVWRIRARQVVIATGAHERPLIFAGNDRPGVMLSGAVRTYLNRYAVLARSRVLVATTNDSAYLTAEDLLASGADLLGVVDTRPELSTRAAQAARRGVRVMTNSCVVRADGHDAVTAAGVGRIDGEGRTRTIACDLVAVSGGWSPVVHLHSQRQGTLRWDDALAALVPVAPVRDQHVVGAAAGVFTLSGALTDGTRAGVAASRAAGFDVSARPPNGRSRENHRGPIRPLWLTPAPDGEPADRDDHFVDLQRDQTVADLWRAVGAGMRSVEHIKRYTSIGTAHDQGRTSAVNTIALVAAAIESTIASVGTTTFRPPYTPVSFAALAGRERGDLFDPARTTPVHSWHVEHGARFEVVGQWLRPWYYPRAGEDIDVAVARECRAARNTVAMMDASTLGKIEIRGADAGTFLNRVYTNAFAALAVGSARYGVMCQADGMIFDDGVTVRLAEDRYFMTTTTGGAAAVLEWLEEWLQTEWQELDVYCTSVTEQWTTIAVVGPRSRDVLARVAPELDVSRDGFPFMTFRQTTLAAGVPARICRISFSGELAFEVNVSGWYGRAVWEEIYAAGEDLGITPYGTETMHVLRAEKGYPIVGQDTDGTVTPRDAGMDWVVSKRKDFVGRRSLDRPDTARTDRQHMVGVLSVDRRTRLPEGTHLIALDAAAAAGDGPVRSLGHVTSSYHSEALGEPFGLALVTDGRNRIGDCLLASAGDTRVLVRVTGPVLYDPEGTKRDG